MNCKAAANKVTQWPQLRATFFMVSLCSFYHKCSTILIHLTTEKLLQAKGRHLVFLHDRIMAMSGKPQKYGTQFYISENGKVILLPIENPQIVDKLREKIGLESLAERTKKVKDIQCERIKNRTKNS